MAVAPSWVPAEATWDATTGSWVSNAQDWIDWEPDSPLFFGGVTSARTATPMETTLCMAGTFTVTLPAPFANGENVVVNTGSGTITVAPPSGVTLYGLTGGTGNISLTQGQSASFRSDGTSWYRVQ